jgi:hypothetical protein
MTEVPRQHHPSVKTLPIFDLMEYESLTAIKKATHPTEGTASTSQSEPEEGEVIP